MGKNKFCKTIFPVLAARPYEGLNPIFNFNSEVFLINNQSCTGQASLIVAAAGPSVRLLMVSHHCIASSM